MLHRFVQHLAPSRGNGVAKEEAKFLETLQVSARKWTFTLYIYIYIIIYNYVCVCVDLYPFVYLFIFIRYHVKFTPKSTTSPPMEATLRRTSSGLLQKLVVQRHNGLGIGCHCLRCGGWDLLMKLTLRIPNLKGKVMTNPFLLILNVPQIITKNRRPSPVSENFRLANLTFNWSPLENNLKIKLPFVGFSPLILKTSQPRSVYY